MLGHFQNLSHEGPTCDQESQSCYWVLFSVTRFLISRTPHQESKHRLVRVGATLFLHARINAYQAVGGSLILPTFKDFSAQLRTHSLASVIFIAPVFFLIHHSFSYRFTANISVATKAKLDEIGVEAGSNCEISNASWNQENKI